MVLEPDSTHFVIHDDRKDHGEPSMFAQDKYAYIVGNFEEASADLAIERRAGGGVASASAAAAACD